MIVLTDPGALGLPIGHRLRFLGRPVRFVCEDAAACQDMQHSGIEAEVLPSDPAQAAVLLDADAVVLEGIPSKDQVGWHERVLAAAEAAGTGLVVRVGPAAAQPTSPSPRLRRQARTEAAVDASPLPHAVLRHALFMQDLLLFAERLRHDGRWVTCLGDASIPYVDARDVVDATVAVLDGDLPRRPVRLTGPASFTTDEVLRLLGLPPGSKRLDVDPGRFRDVLRDGGMPAEKAAACADLLAHYRLLGRTAPTDALAGLTGAPPRSLAAFLEEHHDRFVEGGGRPVPRPAIRLAAPLSW